MIFRIAVDVHNYIKFCNILQNSVYCINNFRKFNIINLLQFSSIYLVNLISLKNKFIDKLLNTKLIYSTVKKKVLIKKNIFNQYCLNKTEFNIYNNKFYRYFNLPTKNFFENKEIFFNTQGLLKNTNKIIFNKTKKSNWKLIRTIFNQLKKKLLNNNKYLINFNGNSTSFVNIVNFLLLATTNFKQNNSLLKPNSFIINQLILLTKKKVKLNNTKITFWLNDFFINGKDNFSKNSILMLKCSKISRFNKTNFF